MTVYLVHLEDVGDDGLTAHGHFIYANLEDAKQKAQQLIQSYKNGYPNLFNDPNWEVEETDCSLEMYDKGYYCLNHIVIDITKLEVQ